MDKTLVADVGGRHVKLLIEGEEQRQFDSGPKMRRDEFVRQLKAKTRDWKVDNVSIGFPSVVRGGKIVKEAKHLGPGGGGFDFDKALGNEVRDNSAWGLKGLGSYGGDG